MPSKCDFLFNKNKTGYIYIYPLLVILIYILYTNIALLFSLSSWLSSNRLLRDRHHCHSLVFFFLPSEFWTRQAYHFNHFLDLFFLFNHANSFVNNTYSKNLSSLLLGLKNPSYFCLVCPHNYNLNFFKLLNYCYEQNHSKVFKSVYSYYRYSLIIMKLIVS
jgi:hypothetical protein